MRSLKNFAAALILTFAPFAYGVDCGGKLDHSPDGEPTLLEQEHAHIQQHAADIPEKLRAVLQSELTEEQKRNSLKYLIYRNPYFETRMRTPILRALVDQLIAQPNMSVTEITTLLAECMAKETQQMHSHIARFIATAPDVPALNLNDRSRFEKQQLPKLQIYRLKKELTFHEFLNQIYYAVQKQWRAEMHIPETQLQQKVLVATLSDPAHTTVTVFNTFYGMNMALNRASHYIEDQPVLLWGDELFGNRAAGHDLRAPDLKRYIEVRDNTPAPALSDEEASRLAIEREFFSHIVRPAINRNANAVILGVTTGAIGAVVLEHEIYHAKFFTDPVFAEMAKEFWREHVAEGDRNAWREVLSKYGYDPRNEELMYNEFQAYALERDTEAVNVDYPDVLAVITKYISSFKHFLNDKGVRLLD